MALVTWFRRLLKMSESESNLNQEQAFWNGEVLAIPICSLFVQKYTDILMELTELTMDRQPFMKFPDYGLYSTGWEAFPLSVYEGEFNEHVAECASVNMTSIANSIRMHAPILSELIAPHEQAGYMRNVFVSRLRPGSLIRPHRGWTQQYLRIHLGLLCDPGCRITVGEETQTWYPGKLLAFKDGGPHMHSVRHEGNRDRIVISFDLRLSYVKSFIPTITSE